MKKGSIVVILTLAMAFLFSVTVHAAPDFSGTWVLDINKSDTGITNPAAKAKMQKVTLVIKQTSTKLTIQRSTGDTAVYNLDGTDSKNSLPGGGQTKTNMKWAGDTLVAKTTSSSGGSSSDVRSLSANGKEMVVKITTRLPGGERKQTLIYNKQ
jgi:hypothetical protein